MAGLSGHQVVVDVVALSEVVAPSRVPEPAPPPEPEPPADPQCPFGHASPPGTAYCGTCGIKMGAAAGRPDLTAVRPVPAGQLDAEARAERDRQHAEAVAAAGRFEHAPERIVPNPGQGVLIHFIEDGLTVFGRVWYRGQEIEIGPDHPRWADAVGWITLDRAGQAARWGRQYFEHGPWPGLRDYQHPSITYEQLTARGPDGNPVTFAGPGDEQLAQANRAEAQRGRGVPAAAFR
jgi:hypothetical protein